MIFEHVLKTKVQGWGEGVVSYSVNCILYTSMSFDLDTWKIMHKDMCINILNFELLILIEL